MISLVLKVKKPLDSGSVALPFMSMSGTEGQDFLVVFWSLKRIGFLPFWYETAGLCFYTPAWNWVCFFLFYLKQLIFVH